MTTKNKKEQYCVNCGCMGHISKLCDQPITSYGLIFLPIDIDIGLKLKIFSNMKNIDRNETGIWINKPSDIELFCKYKNEIKFLLIRRKHTLGFTEFIRGRYDVKSIEGIKQLFKQMTIEEIEKIEKMTFEKLWVDTYGNAKIRNVSDYMSSKDKFNQLKEKTVNGLEFYTGLKKTEKLWEEPEWGFPKGRRNFKEPDKMCASREFMEETYLSGTDFIVIPDLEPISEIFTGTDGKEYKHVYYFATSSTDSFPELNIHQNNHEIGDIGYFSYEEAMSKIRIYHTTRLQIITQVHVWFMNSLLNIN